MVALTTILVTGANGQLGQSFLVLSKSYPDFHFIFADKSVLQISNEADVNLFFEKNKIDVCINCAAYTAVDKAETEKELAVAVNTTAVGNLAKYCKKYHAQFIHFSTDYVFDGTSTIPYEETHTTNPVNFYGKTKLDGELLAIANNSQSIIIRTAWVYSAFGNNFVKTMLRLMNEKQSIQVVNDQRGAPTYAADLADVVMKIITKKNFIAGTYHYSDSGNISWYDFAKQIAFLSKSQCKVLPITTAQFPTPAARPSYSVLNTNKIHHTFNLQIKEWQPSLLNCIQQLTN